MNLNSTNDDDDSDRMKINIPHDPVRDETNDALDLFSTIIHSLAADAAAIRQMTDVAELAGILPDGARINNSSNSSSNNNNSSNNSSNNNNSIDRESIERLRELDRAISGIERKVAALRQIINEENAALDKFETTLREEADEQTALIRGLMAALELKQRDENENEIEIADADADEAGGAEQQQQRQQQQQPQPNEQRTLRWHESSDRGRVGESQSHLIHRGNGEWFHGDSDHLPANSSRLSPPRRIANRIANHRRALQPKSDLPSSSSSSFPSGGSTPAPTPTPTPTPARRNDKPRNDDSFPDRSAHEDRHRHRQSFVPVTEDELRNQTRFGPHLCRYDVNEALEEIQQMVWNKMALEEHHHHQYHAATAAVAAATTTTTRTRTTTTHPSGLSSQSSLQRRLDYLRQRHQRETNPGAALATDTHAGHSWVSEQELRENCAFFRHGESTARSTLQLLCSLKRLRQVPGKKTEVTYLCLF